MNISHQSSGLYVAVVPLRCVILNVLNKRVFPHKAGHAKDEFNYNACVIKQRNHKIHV